jgi:hypothetical protein
MLRRKRPGLAPVLAQVSNGDLAAGSLAAGSLAVVGRRPVPSLVGKPDRNGIPLPRGAPEQRLGDGSSSSRLVQARKHLLPLRVQDKPGPAGKPVPGDLAAGKVGSRKGRKVGNAGMPGGAAPILLEHPPIHRSPRRRLKDGPSPARCPTHWAI